MRQRVRQCPDHDFLEDAEDEAAHDVGRVVHDVEALLGGGVEDEVF